MSSNAGPVIPGVDSANPLPLDLTVDQIQSAMQARIVVYNPTDFRHTPQVGGRYYTFDPLGEVAVSDIMTWQRVRTEDGRTVTAIHDHVNPGQYNVRSYIVNDARFPPLVAMRAQDVARYLVGQEGLGEQGFIILAGDGRDEERKQRARDKWLGWYSEYARGVEQQWVSQVSRFREGNPGAPPPRQPRRVREILSWLDKFDRGLVDRKQWICGVCSMEFDGEVELKGHESRRHPGLESEKRGEAGVQNVGATAPDPDPAPAPTKATSKVPDRRKR